MLCGEISLQHWHPPWPVGVDRDNVDLICDTPEEGVKFASWRHIRKFGTGEWGGCKLCAFKDHPDSKCLKYDCNNGIYLGPATRVLLRMGAL